MSGSWVDVADMEQPTAPEAMYAAESASYILYVLSGRRWPGVQTVTEEYYCGDRYSCCGEGGPPAQYVYRGDDVVARIRREVNLTGWDPTLVFFRRRPVREVLSVRRIATGETLGASQYAVYDHTYLGPTAAAACSSCWDPCGLEITYTFGTLPPPMGQSAALVLANEMVKSVLCPDECRLPDRLSSVSRQGVNYTVFDAQDFLRDGRIGLYEVDVFLKAVNPNHAQLPARVFSPDVPRGRRVTWPVIQPRKGAGSGFY